MENWEIFEHHPSTRLNEKFNKYGIHFKPTGGKNSNTSDISVFNSKGTPLFSIEAKLSPAQCGQFVVFLQNENYILTKNSRLSNDFTSEIIKHINDHLKNYTYNSPTYFDLNCDQILLYNWVYQHYKKKGSLFFVTSTQTAGFISLIDIEMLQNHITFSARVRIKKSGTRHIAKKSITSVITELKEHLDNLDIFEYDVQTSDGITTLKLKNNERLLAKCERYFGENTFLSKMDTGNHYSIKTRAKTSNMNVIFSIQYNGPVEDIGADEFLKFLKSKKFI